LPPLSSFRGAATNGFPRPTGPSGDRARPPCATQIAVSFDPSLLEVLVCPVSKAPLRLLRAGGGEPEVLVCPQSRLLYPIEDGVPVLLREAAIELSEGELRDQLARDGVP
jgi:uncharacterized protein